MDQSPMFPDRPTSRPETDEASTEPVTVELYVRSLAGGAARTPQDTVIERLSRLEREGSVDEYAVHVWGRRVSPDSAAAETSAGRFVLDRIERFREWARRNGASLESSFDTREVDCSITGESYTVTTVPTVTLAEFHGDELHRVTPCRGGETVCTVEDHLDALHTDGRPEGGRGDEGEGTDERAPAAARPEGAPVPGLDGGDR